MEGRGCVWWLEGAWPGARTGAKGLGVRVTPPLGAGAGGRRTLQKGESLWGSRLSGKNIAAKSGCAMTPPVMPAAREGGGRYLHVGGSVAGGAAGTGE